MPAAERTTAARVEEVVSTDGLGGSKLERARKGGESVEETMLAIGEQVVRPRHCGPQGLVSLDATASRAAEQPKTITEAFEDLRRRERSAPRRGKLDGERDAVEMLTDRPDRAEILVTRVERTVRRSGAVDEQLARLAVGFERRNDPDLLTGNPEWLAARGEHSGRRASRGHRSHHRGGRVEDVFAVVDDQQESTPAEQVEMCVLQRQSRLRLHRQARGHRSNDSVGVGHGSQLDNPRAVRSRFRGKGCNLDGEARLAHAAGACERHQLVVSQVGDPALQIGDSTDERRRGDRQVPLRRRPGQFHPRKPGVRLDDRRGHL